MPTFWTPDGVTVSVNLPIGDVLFVASDRTDTVVLARAGDDVTAELRVSYADGRLFVDGPLPSDALTGWLGLEDSIEARIDLPEGSTVLGVASEGGFRGTGRLGACTLRTDCGEIVLEETGPLTAVTDSGDIAVDRVGGDADVTSGSGVIQIRRIDGRATVHNEYGETEIGEITGELVVRGHDSDLLVGRAHGDVRAFSESGDIRIVEAVRGTVETHSDSGDIEISVPRNTAVTVDLRAPNGRERDTVGRATDPALTIGAHSAQGDVTVMSFPRRTGPAAP
ncbi:DUF4097 family beta strand repeat-containing protein [Streptomyces rubiginosohelvolus]